MPHPVLEASQRYRAALLAHEQEAANRLVQAYGRAYAATERNRNALIERVAAGAPNGAAWTEKDIRNLDIMDSLLGQIRDQVNRYAVYADMQIANEVGNSITRGLADSTGLVEAHFSGNPNALRAIRARFDRLHADAVETALGFTAADSPLRERLVGRLGEVVAGRVADALVEGITTGMNPRQVARVLQKQMGQGLTWSLTTARTAQVWSYREASRQNYMANRDICAGWSWLSARDSRCCVSCLSKDGQHFSVDEVLNDHHSGRCTALVLLNPSIAAQYGLSEPDIGTGEAWFNGRSEQAQQEQMGVGMWQAWKDGKFGFRDLSTTYQDVVYGTMRRAPTLRELVGDTPRARQQAFSLPSLRRPQPRPEQPATVRLNVVEVEDLGVTIPVRG